MAASSFRAAGALAAILFLGNPAAYAAEPQIEAAPLEQAQEPGAAQLEGPAEINPDESADLLNSRQQIQQSFTFTRTINGEVVDTEKRTVTYSRKDPLRETEAGVSALDRLKSAFDSEVLTRTEAFEEAKLDFVIADKDRDNMMTADEFVGLAEQWRTNNARDPQDVEPETARERQYRAFLDELDPEGAKEEADTNARRKFATMVGMAPSISREDYLSEYLLDFDSMDSDNDGILRGDELMMFRALNRGESTGE